MPAQATTNITQPVQAVTMLVLLAGTTWSVMLPPAAAQVVQPQQPGQPQRGPQVNLQANQAGNQAGNQVGNQVGGVAFRRVFADDAVGAQEALVRVQELEAAQNISEAARVVQSVLLAEAEQVLASDQPRVFEPVRAVVHRMLLRSPALLERYQSQQEAAARDLLSQGDFETVERAYFMTDAGFEATLRLAQWQMERARFHAARITLAQLETHPARRGTRSLEAARLLAQLAAFIRPELVASRVQAWAKDGGDTVALPAQAVPPAGAVAIGRDGYAPSPSPIWAGLGQDPLQSTMLGNLAREVANEQAAGFEELETRDELERASPRFAWVMPTVLGETLYVNDGDSVAALDASTLAELWRVTPSQVSTRRINEDAFFGGTARSLEDVATVGVGRGVVVAAMGLARGAGRDGDSRVHALDAQTGRELWAVEPSWLDERLEGTSVRGTPLIEGDVVVLTLRKPGLLRRVTSLYHVGLDLATGELRWVRVVGSVGMQPWGRSQTRVDTGVLVEGVVYRGDDMGLISAYEATTGRCLWMRLTTPVPEPDPSQQFALSGEQEPTFRVHQPVAIGRFVFCVEPHHGSVLALDPATGHVQARIDERATGGKVDYLVAAGPYLAMVGTDRIGVVEADKFSPSGVLLSPRIPEAMVGRALALDGPDGWKLAVPTVSGVVLLDASNPQNVDTHGIVTSGNLLVAGTPDDPGGLLLADPSRLHAFLSWERAEAGLKRRADASPTDPMPTLTYLELALRKGKFELAPGLADRALAITRSPAPGVDAIAARTRLFTLLHTTLVRSRAAITSGTGHEGATDSQMGSTLASTPVPREAAQTVRIAPDNQARNESPNANRATAAGSASGLSHPHVLRDPALMAQLEQRLSRAADTPVQRVQALLERAFLREFEQKAAQAVDALQEVLLDDALAEAELPATPVAAASGDVQRAEDVALAQLAALLERWGPAPYASYDEEARRLLEQLPAQASPKDVASLARRYPLALASSAAWRRVGEAHVKTGDTDAARSAYRNGVTSAQAGLRIGRDAQSTMLGELLGELVTLATRPGDAQPVQRLLLELKELAPGLRVRVGGSVGGPEELSLDDAEQRLREQHARGNRTAPLLGASLRSRPQVIEGWNPMQAVDSDLPGAAHDIVLMSSRRQDRLAAFGTSALTGRLEMLWEREVAITPVVVRVTVSQTIVFWPASGNATLEAISNISGKSLWTSPVLSSLAGWATQPRDATTNPLGPANKQVGVAGGGANARADQLNTPLDGIVRGEDLLFSVSGHAGTDNDGIITICDRRGRIAALSLADGRSLWSGALSIVAVYDLEQESNSAASQQGEVAGNVAQSSAGRVLVVGASGGGATQEPVVLCLDLQSGRELWRVDPRVLGRHARFARFIAGGDVLVATGDGLVRVGHADGRVLWASAAPGVREAMGAWIVPDVAGRSGAGGAGEGGGGGGFVLNGDFQLWRFDLATGKVGDAPISMQDRIWLPFTARVVGNRLVLTSSMGVAMVRANGQLAGADALDSPGRLEPGIICEGEVLVLESGDREQLDTGEVMNATRMVRVDVQTAKLRGQDRLTLFEAPDSVHVLDRKLLIGQGPFTLVYDVD